MAASIASSAAVARGALDWARADVADTVRKVAATAISARSNPPRLFEQSRIVTPPWAKLSRQRDRSNIVCFQPARERRPRSLQKSPRTHRVNTDDTCAVLKQLAEPGATHEQLTSNDPFLFRIARFCHAIRRLSVTCKPRFEGSGLVVRPQKCRYRRLAIPDCLSSPHRHCRALSPRPRRACDRAWSGRFSTAGLLPTSVRDSARSQSG